MPDTGPQKSAADSGNYIGGHYVLVGVGPGHLGRVLSDFVFQDLAIFGLRFSVKNGSRFLKKVGSRFLKKVGSGFLKKVGSRTFSIFGNN